MTEEENLQNLFSTLNQISADTITGNRTGGGSGGGSMPTTGNMNPNPLIQLNPYISKNVTSFVTSVSIPARWGELFFWSSVVNWGGIYPDTSA